MSVQSSSAVASVKTAIAARIRGIGRWRHERPFWGGLLLIVAGLVIGWVPAQFAGDLVLIGGTFTVIGLIFAAFVSLTGIFALYQPQHSTMFGVAGIVLSILSIFGALGGLIVGMLIGILGGNLCLSWKPPDADEDDG